MSPEVEMDRVLPLVEAIKREEGGPLAGALVSVDTFYWEVAQEALRLGADMVNDVTAGAFDEGGQMHRVVAEFGCPYVMMHSRGCPKTMQSAENTTYGNLISDVARELEAKAQAAIQAGVMPWSIITDPGVGFAKAGVAQNCEIIARASEIRREFHSGFLSRAPMLVGPSRKGFLSEIVQKADPAERDVATAAALVIAASQNCNIFRAHNVEIASDALKVADALLKTQQK